MNKDNLKKHIKKQKDRNRKNLLLEFTNNKNQEVIFYEHKNIYIIELKQSNEKKVHRLFSTKDKDKCYDEYFKICRYFSNK